MRSELSDQVQHRDKPEAGEITKPNGSSAQQERPKQASALAEDVVVNSQGQRKTTTPDANIDTNTRPAAPASTLLTSALPVLDGASPKAIKELPDRDSQDELVLLYRIEKETPQGNMKYKIVEPTTIFRKGDAIRLQFRTTADAYLYIFDSGEFAAHRTRG